MIGDAGSSRMQKFLGIAVFSTSINCAALFIDDLEHWKKKIIKEFGIAKMP